MAASQYKIKKSKKNGQAAYPKTLVEAIFWDEKKKPLSEVLNSISAGASATSMPVGGMLPNVVYELGELDKNTAFTLAAPVDGAVNHYYWTFDAADDITITWPAEIIAWNGGDAPVIADGKHYEISVLNGVACFIETEIPE